MARSNVIITAGLGAGDEGKGGIVDYLARRYEAGAVLRYNGGPQAAHYVVKPDGTWHCFSQFGSGTFVPSVETHLCRSMFIKPQNMINEEQSLRQNGITDAFSRISIDPSCPIVTPYHAMIGQMLELERGADRHGSVGMGVGQAVREYGDGEEAAITVHDLLDMSLIREKLAIHSRDRIAQAEEIRKRSPGAEMDRIFHYFSAELSQEDVLSSYRHFTGLIPGRIVKDEEYLEDLISRRRGFIFEGAQGALIDVDYGFWPYVTKTTTTTSPAEDLIRPFGDRVEVKKLGIMRGYSYRHGPGPIVTEDPLLSRLIPERHNKATEWQGHIRKGWLDLIAARYAILANNSVDAVALTHVDSLSMLTDFRVCLSYIYQGQDIDRLSEYFRWHRSREGQPEIEALILRGSEMSRARTDMLSCCRPGDWRVFSGEPERIDDVDSLGRLPSRMRHFMDFLNEELMPGVPLTALSYGETALQKYEMAPLF
jgi:adenylosuccinate synthase